MDLFDAEALRTFSSKQNHQKSRPLKKGMNYRYFYHPCKDLKKINYIYYITLGTLTINMLCRSLENDPFSTYCLILPNSIREINGKENYKLLILDTFRSVESEKQKQKLY